MLKGSTAGHQGALFVSLLQLRRLIHIFVCFIAGLVPLVSAERWHIVITFLPQKPVARMGEKWLMGAQPALCFHLCLQADTWQHQRRCCHAVPIWVYCPTCVLILALLLFSRSFHVFHVLSCSERLFVIPN